MARSTKRDQAAGFFSHPLAYVRAERDWTYQDLVDVIARHVGNMATRREKAWKWEHWGVVPDRESQVALAAELGVPQDLVRKLGWPNWLPTGERLNIELPWTADASLMMLDQTAGAAVLDRRAFLTLSAGTMVAVANQWSALEAPRLQAALRGGRVEAGVVECFEQRLPTIRQMQYALGGGSVRNLADAELRLVTDLLNHGSYTANVGHACSPSRPSWDGWLDGRASTRAFTRRLSGTSWQVCARRMRAETGWSVPTS